MNKSTQFKKGNPGGPGRPKGSISLNKRLQDYLDQEVYSRNPLDESEPERKFLLKDLVAMKLICKAAIEGDMRAITEVFDRVEGKAQQTVKSANFNVDVRTIKQMSDEELEALQEEIMKSVTDDNYDE